MSRWKCRCCPGQRGALCHVTVNTATMADLLRAMRNAWQPLSTGAPVLDRDEQWPAHHVEGRLAVEPAGQSLLRYLHPSFGHTRRYPASTSNSVRISQVGNVFRGSRKDTNVVNSGLSRVAHRPPL